MWIPKVDTKYLETYCKYIVGRMVIKKTMICCERFAAENITKNEYGFILSKIYYQGYTIQALIAKLKWTNFVTLCQIY